MNQDGASVVDGQQARTGITVNGGVTATVERFVIENGARVFFGGGGTTQRRDVPRIEVCRS